MIATIRSSTLFGVDGVDVSVEVHVSNGLPAFNIVGLPDTACREARDRVRAALMSSNLPWPTKRVTVNLAPSGVKKVGTGFDLPIAVGLLVAAEAIPVSAVDNCGFLGELGLDGSVRRVRAVVPLVAALRRERSFVPMGNAGLAASVSDTQVVGVTNLVQLVAMLTGEEPIAFTEPPASYGDTAAQPDMRDVLGQPVARWAVEIAAAGGHNLLMSGPPGAGKTMLAQRMRGLLPDLDQETARTCTQIHSAAGTIDDSDGTMLRPPLRAPHHTASVVALVGGGSGVLRPGEISLAHGGLLFLDELCEFNRAALEALRQPLEQGSVSIARAGANMRFPSRFQLVAATNPCPCGAVRGPDSCTCDAGSISRYRSRMSGPLLDRFDMRVVVSRPEADRLIGGKPEEDTATIRERVLAARARAVERKVACNAQLTEAQLAEVQMTNAARLLIKRRLELGRLSGRGVDRIRRVALTIADLEGHMGVLEDSHIASALELHTLSVGSEAA